ncbi:MAG: zinc-ribbon domain-containing protein [Gemmatimonadales bacterium]|jgi:hypothetical protein
MTTSSKRQCTTCGAPLSADAQFCHACGASQTSTSTTPGISMPWLLGGVGVALIAVALLAYSIGRSSTAAPSGTATQPTGGTAPFTGAPPDISDLSPRQAADSLFNMVMWGHETGDVARVTMFLPMALRAYESLGELDPDAHYHVGLISYIAADFEVALAHADSMEQQVPNNLLAVTLRYRVAQALRDEAEMREQSRRFLEHYEEQIALDRPEYRDHRTIIENFRVQAEAAVGG